MNSSNFVDQSTSSFEDLANIIEDVFLAANQRPDGMICLIGGMAISFWFIQLIINSDEPADGFFFDEAFSDDVDFFGKRGAVEICESGLGVTFDKPEPLSPSPNVGRAILASRAIASGIVVDVLRGVHGIDDKTIQRGLCEILFRGTSVRLMNPLLCLQSRLANLFAGFCTDPAREAMRAKLCIELTTRYLQRELATHGYRHCSKLVKQIERLATSELSIKAKRAYGVQVPDILVNAGALPESYRNGQLVHFMGMYNRKTGLTEG